MTATIHELSSSTEKTRVEEALQELSRREGVKGVEILTEIVRTGTIRDLGPEGYETAKWAVERGLLEKIGVRPGQLGGSNLTPNFSARYEPCSGMVVTLLEQFLSSGSRG